MYPSIDLDYKKPEIKDLNFGFYVIDINKFNKIFGRTPTFKNKFFSIQEQQLCNSFKNPINYYAGIFAAKIASVKALKNISDDLVRIIDCEVSYNKNRPYITLHNFADKVAKDHNIDQFELSISHNKTEANAIVVAINSNDHKSAKKLTTAYDDSQAQINANFKEIKRQLNL